MSLVAENKWLLSGTPISSSIADLALQLEFLGVDQSKRLASRLVEHVGCKVNEKSAKRCGSEPSGVPKSQSVGMFTFLMCLIMMRHSQEMIYSGTSTTPMSLPPKEWKTCVYQIVQISLLQPVLLCSTD